MALTKDEVILPGHDRTQLANMAHQTKNLLDTEVPGVVADRGYSKSEEILDGVDALPDQNARWGEY